MSDREANRLTDEDRDRITARMAESVATWQAAVGRYTPRWGDLSTLEILGVHAIGCTLADLRDGEAEWLRAAAIAALGLTVPAA